MESFQISTGTKNNLYTLKKFEHVIGIWKEFRLLSDEGWVAVAPPAPWVLRTWNGDQKIG